MPSAMAKLEVVKKVSFLKVWLDNVFTDDLAKVIAAHAKAEKGKKVKARLNRSGLTLTRSRFLQEQKSQSFPLSDIKTVTRNPVFPACVMIIMSDPKIKYRIIALRCESDGDATHMSNVFAEIRKDVQSANIEFRKRENGNWTLRERSAHNAHKQLTEIFNEQKQPNGDVSIKQKDKYVPVLDASRVYTNGRPQKGVYVKRSTINTTNNNYKISKDDADDFVIETEVSSYPYSTSDITPRGKLDSEEREMRDELDGLESEMRRIKASLENAEMRDSRHSGVYSQPVVYSSGSASPSRPEKTSSLRVYETKTTTSPAGYYTNPWASHRRVSGTFGVPVRLDHLPESTTGGQKVKFDQVSLRSNTSRVSRSLRASDFSIPTTVRRNIEDTYPRPVVIRRRANIAHVVAPRPRPATYHPRTYHQMTADEIRVFVSDDDVAL